MAKQKRKQSSNWPLIAFGVGLAALIGVTVFIATRPTPPEPPKPCTPTKAQTDVAGVEKIPCVGQTHVLETTKVAYGTDTPTSGDHYPITAKPDFYTAKQTPEVLVHNLEHGNIVIYYDPSLPKADLDTIKALTQQFGGQWDGVLAVPRTDAQHPVVLTAWERRLPLTKYDKDQVSKFVDTYRGRGPENPVR